MAYVALHAARILITGPTVSIYRLVALRLLADGLSGSAAFRVMAAVVT